MLGKRSRTLQRTRSAREIGMGRAEGAENPRPSVQVIGFNPKAPFDDVGSSSHIDGETASNGSAQAGPVLGGLSSLFQNNKLTPVEESSTVHGKFLLKDLDGCKKYQGGPVDMPAYRNLPVIDFLAECYLCKQPLGPEQDIYMYRGDRAFCSVECRWQQILVDERTEKCASAALNRPSVAA